MEIVTLINTLEGYSVLERSVGHMKVNAQDTIVYKSETSVGISVGSDEYTNLRQLCIVEKNNNLYLYLTLEAVTGDWYFTKYLISEISSINISE